MEGTQIISFLGTLGLGGLIGVILKSIFDIKLSDKKMLFDARIRTYSGLTTHLFNSFDDLDTSDVCDRYGYYRKINEALAEPMLLASHGLAKKFTEYRALYTNQKANWESFDSNEKKDSTRKLVRCAAEIHTVMRRELHVDHKTIFEGLNKKYI